MPKTKKELLQELLDLEDEKVVDVVEEGGNPPLPNPHHPQHNQGNNRKLKPNISAGGWEGGEPPSSEENSVQQTKPKREKTQKQMEAFEKAKAIRDANYAKRKEERERIAREEKEKLEEKLVKKAIAVKKKQIKKQAILEELSDDETEAPPKTTQAPKKKETKEISQPTPAPVPAPSYPVLRFF